MGTNWKKPHFPKSNEEKQKLFDWLKEKKFIKIMEKKSKTSEYFYYKKIHDDHTFYIILRNSDHKKEHAWEKGITPKTFFDGKNKITINLEWVIGISDKSFNQQKTRIKTKIDTQISEKRGISLESAKAIRKVII